MFCYLGNNLIQTTQYKLSIDSELVTDDAYSFRKGLEMLYTSYYVFNLQYNVEIAATMEFLQR